MFNENCKHTTDSEVLPEPKVISAEYIEVKINNSSSYYIITIDSHDYISPCLGCSSGKLIHSENCQNIKCNETVER